MKKEQFVVDAALLRELGERLIGQPAIALGELVKNSYDADAATCVLEFREDEIVVADNGHGMSQNDFLNYWMRIGTTHKVEEATSRFLHRPLTGSKGIGRLTPQFLGNEMILESTSIEDPQRCLYAIVDWRTAVPGQTLSTVHVDWEIRRDPPNYPLNSVCGTRITVKGLKQNWTAELFRDLGTQVWMLRSPFKRSAQPEEIERLRELRKRSPQDFFVEIEAPQIATARHAFEETLDKVFSNWQARIRGKIEDGRSGRPGAISIEFRRGYPEGSRNDKSFRTTVHLPAARNDGEATEPLLDRATFEILIFKVTGRQPSGIPVADLRKYLEQFGNVSVYDAGFRLPYYGGSREAVGQDWLSIAVDQARRLSVSELLPERLRTQNKYMLDLPALGRIFGAVEINTNHERRIAERLKSPNGTWLEIQSSRDRLTPNAAFMQLHDFVRYALDYYANRHRLLLLEESEQKRAKEPPSKKYDRAIKVLENNKHDIPKPVFLEVRREVAEALKATKVEERVQDSRAALLAPLASAGMVALALNHELSRESGYLRKIGKELRRIATQYSISDLTAMADEFDQARDRLDSLRELFAPLISEEDRSATDRLKVRAVVDQTVGGMRALMPGVNFDRTGIPSDLRFPLGSLADWNAILQNILANAWNALLDSDRALVAFRGGKTKGGREWLRVSDSGQGLSVPLAEAHKLFEPFEHRIQISKDKRSIAIGGQGLGLTIVRMIAHRRSAEVAFVSPEEGFSTTLELSWRGATR